MSKGIPGYTELEALRRQCHTELHHRHFKQKVPMYQIAEECCVAPSTVSKFIYGETRFPRFSTVAGIARCCGYQITWRKQL